MPNTKEKGEGKDEVPFGVIGIHGIEALVAVTVPGALRVSMSALTKEIACEADMGAVERRTVGARSVDGIEFVKLVDAMARLGDESESARGLKAMIAERFPKGEPQKAAEMLANLDSLIQVTESLMLVIAGGFSCEDHLKLAEVAAALHSERDRRMGERAAKAEAANG